MKKAIKYDNFIPLIQNIILQDKGIYQVTFYGIFFDEKVAIL